MRTALMLLAIAASLRAQETLPEGNAGLAAKYPGDKGIGQDPDVVFAEGFEEDDIAQVKSRWETALGDLSLTEGGVPPGSAGRKSLLVSHVGGKGTGGQLYRRLKNASGGWGYDHLFARFLVKFDPGCAPIHHFGTSLGGNHPATSWPVVSAGNRPDGAKHFISDIEPHGKSWVWDYYTYWCEMRGSPPKGQTWGNTFVRDPGLKVERGTWISVEMMIKMNDVGDTNGEHALWIDGKRVSHLGKGFPKGTWVFDKFTPGETGPGITWEDGRKEIAGGRPFDGFRWRAAKELNVNFLWIYLYITTAAEGHVSKVWFDDVVVAKKYIGPLAK